MRETGGKPGETGKPGTDGNGTSSGVLQPQLASRAGGSPNPPPARPGVARGAGSESRGHRGTAWAVWRPNEVPFGTVRPLRLGESPGHPRRHAGGRFVGLVGGGPMWERGLQSATEGHAKGASSARAYCGGLKSALPEQATVSEASLRAVLGEGGDPPRGARWRGASGRDPAQCGPRH